MVGAMHIKVDFAGELIFGGSSKANMGASKQICVEVKSFDSIIQNDHQAQQDIMRPLSMNVPDGGKTCVSSVATRRSSENTDQV